MARLGKLYMETAMNERRGRVEDNPSGSQQLQELPTVTTNTSCPLPMPAEPSSPLIPPCTPSRVFLGQWNFQNLPEETVATSSAPEWNTTEASLPPHEQTVENPETTSADLDVLVPVQNQDEITSPLSTQTLINVQPTLPRRRDMESKWRAMGKPKDKVVSKKRAIQRLEKLCSEQKDDKEGLLLANSKLNKENQELEAQITELKESLSQASKGAPQDPKQTLDGNAMTITLKELTELQDVLSLREFEVQYLGEVVEEQKQKLDNLDGCHPTTLRSFLIMRHVEQASIAELDEEASSNDREMSAWVPTGLPQSQLDKVLSWGEIQSLAKLLPKGRTFNSFYVRLKLDICAVCSKAKLKVNLGPQPKYQAVKWLHEYVGPSRYFTCCQDSVCKQCFETHLLGALQHFWWNNLGTLNWFTCPRPGCDEQLQIWCEQYLESCLKLAVGKLAGEYVTMYPKALIYREALRNLETVPNEDALTTAAKITRRLVETDHMYSPFDTRFESNEPDETGCLPEFQAGSIYLADVDQCTSPVPLFLKLFRRQSSFKECIACGKRLFDIAYGNVDAWKLACADFSGPWMWKVLSFPTSETQKCDHDFDVCRACTAEHIRTILESGGASACDSLTCPQCNRKLEYQETIQLADSEVVAKYDKYLFRNYLSKQENFRWCLNPICTNGQVYDYYPRNPRISCEVCDFEMCFKHSVPWHSGSNCIEYESMREHGDPSYAETQQWIKSNTKPCPNVDCGTPIQKGEACFHMTCSQCQHEFCWQCLASWSDIRRRGQEGHADSCFFRTNNMSPVQVRGENLEVALGRAGL